MKILGNRVLISKVEEEKKEGEFETVNVQDSFVNKGKIEQLGSKVYTYKPVSEADLISIQKYAGIEEGDIVLFAKYSPDTQEVKHEGKDMKIINVDDILAIL